MIEKIEAFAIICDNCGKYLEDRDSFTMFIDGSQAWEDAKESGWIEHDGKHICDECHYLDEDDNIKIKKFSD